MNSTLFHERICIIQGEKNQIVAFQVLITLKVFILEKTYFVEKVFLWWYVLIFEKLIFDNFFGIRTHDLFTLTMICIVKSTKNPNIFSV